MTITISPQTETLLRDEAGRLGQNADSLADVLLQSVLAEARQDFEETCQAHRGRSRRRGGGPHRLIRAGPRALAGSEGISPTARPSGHMTPDEPMTTYALRFTQRALADMDDATPVLRNWLTWASLMRGRTASSTPSPNSRPCRTVARSCLSPGAFNGKCANPSTAVRAVLWLTAFCSPCKRDGPDGPTVVILSLRHGARKPITGAEAREMERSE